MKRFSVSIVLAFITVMAFAQAPNPVNWTYEAKKKTADTYEVILTAKVENPWHIYSQHTGKGGPIPTKLSLKKNPLVTTVGATKEIGKVEKVYDKNFQTDVLFFSGKLQLVQTVKIKGNAKTNVSGTVEYMVCDDTQCLPPVKKTFDLKLQ